MAKRLSEVYNELVRSWVPPALPERFEKPEDISEYQEDFIESYTNHFNSLKGSVVESGGEIGVIKSVGLYGVNCEYAPKNDKGGRDISFSSMGRRRFDGASVLEELEINSEISKIKELILKRIAERSV